MDKLLHERLRDNARLKEAYTLLNNGKKRAFIDSAGMMNLADEIERYYIPRPRFEDGEPAQLWDHVDVEGNEEVIENFDYPTTEHCIVRTDCNNCIVTFVDGKNPLKRPTPKVLDADGVEIKVGDTVYIFNGRGKGKKVVVSKFGSTEAPGTYDIPNLVVFDAPENVLTDGVDFALTNDVCHEKPVFDAEGVRICKGDTVWDEDGSYVVTDLAPDKRLKVCTDGGNGGGWVSAELLTHHEWDSLEKLRDDMETCNFVDMPRQAEQWVCRLTALIERNAQ